MLDPSVAPIDDLQPSQLYLCDEKLAAIAEWFDADDLEYDSIQVAAIDGETVVLDGHHRAFAARLAGADDVHVVRASDFDPAPYRECVEWCVDAGIASIDDLAGRVVDREEYGDLWIERCQGAFED